MKREPSLASPRVSTRERTTPKRFDTPLLKPSVPIVEPIAPFSPTPLVAGPIIPAVEPPVVPEKVKAKWTKRPPGTPRDKRPRSAKAEGKIYVVDNEDDDLSDENSRINSPVKEYVRAPAAGAMNSVPKSSSKKQKLGNSSLHSTPLPLALPFPTTASLPILPISIPINVGAKPASTKPALKKVPKSLANARRSGRAAILSRTAREGLVSKRSDGKVAARRAAEAALLLSSQSGGRTIVEKPTTMVLDTIRPDVVMDTSIVEVVQEVPLQEEVEYGMFGKITKWFGWGR